MLAPLYDWKPLELLPVPPAGTPEDRDRLEALRYKLQAVLALGRLGRQENEALERIKTEMLPLQARLEPDTLISELYRLAERWQKAEELDQSGVFLNITPVHDAKIMGELNQIVQRYETLWNTMLEHNPEALQGRHYLGYVL